MVHWINILLFSAKETLGLLAESPSITAFKLLSRVSGLPNPNIVAVKDVSSDKSNLAKQ